MNETQYTLVKLPFRELMDQNYDVRLDRETEISKGYLAVPHLADGHPGKRMRHIQI